MNLTCETSYCVPPANITWFKSSINIPFSSSTYHKSGDLVRTISSVIITVDKGDNGKLVYCIARNLDRKSVRSSTDALNVMCKYPQQR